MSMAASQPRFDGGRIVLMGVAGCGKSSVGAALALATGLPYRDADDLHPAANIEKMRLGEALTDADRWPWLRQVALTLTNSGIVGCSALKRSYRDMIRKGPGGPVTFVHLSGSRAVIESRMRSRKGHFMPPSLLDSQFAALEEPGAGESAVTVDIDQPLHAVVAEIMEKLRGSG